MKLRKLYEEECPDCASPNLMSTENGYICKECGHHFDDDEIEINENKNKKKQTIRLTESTLRQIVKVLFKYLTKIPKLMI